MWQIALFRKSCIRLQRMRIQSVHIASVENVRSFDLIPRPSQLPFLGNWHLYKFGFYDKQKYHDTMNHMYEKYGPIVYEKIGPQEPIIHVFEPEDAETIYRNEDKMPRIFTINEFTKIYREDEGMSLGLGNYNDEPWYKLKRNVYPVMLKTSIVQHYLQEMSIVTDDLVAVIRNERDDNGEIQNLRHLIGRWIMEVAGKICLDKRLGYLRGSEIENGTNILKANDIVFKLGTRMKFAFPFYYYLKTLTLSRLFKNDDTVHRIVMDQIAEVLSKIDPTNAQDREQFTFLSTLLQKSELSQDDVVITATALFLDQLSSTVPTLINNLYALAKNENVQNKMYEEICTVSGDSDEIDLDKYDKLAYLKAVMKETFRVYPNSIEVARINKKPLILSGYYIPPETKLSINLFVHYKSEKHFEEPHSFKPERWMQTSKDFKINPFVLTPFGFGARGCPGRKFAKQILCVSLYKIVKNFRVTCERDKPYASNAFLNLVFPADDLHICFTPR